MRIELCEVELGHAQKIAVPTARIRVGDSAQITATVWRKHKSDQPIDVDACWVGIYETERNSKISKAKQFQIRRCRYHANRELELVTKPGGEGVDSAADASGHRGKYRAIQPRVLGISLVIG